MQELGDLDPLVNLKSLNTLSLLYNPVTSRPHYRLYLIYKLPQLKLLDFQKIKQKVGLHAQCLSIVTVVLILLIGPCMSYIFQERDEAKTLFKSKVGKEIQREIAKKAKTFVPGAGLPVETPANKGML